VVGSGALAPVLASRARIIRAQNWDETKKGTLGNTVAKVKMVVGIIRIVWV